VSHLVDTVLLFLVGEEVHCQLGLCVLFPGELGVHTLIVL